MNESKFEWTNKILNSQSNSEKKRMEVVMLPFFKLNKTILILESELK